MGFEVVRIALTKASGDGHRTMQVMADRLDGHLISIEDCEAISYTLSAIFDVEDGVELRESQGFKIKELNKAQQLAEENRGLIIEKWNEHLG